MSGASANLGPVPFAIQGPERIAFQTANTVFTQVRLPRGKIAFQGLPVSGPAGPAPDGVDQKPNPVRESRDVKMSRTKSRVSASAWGEGLPKHSPPICQNSRYRPAWGRSARNMGPPYHSFLTGAFGPTRVPSRPAPPRRALRPKRQGAAAPIFKKIHFFFHDVGGVAHGPGKQVGAFKRRVRISSYPYRTKQSPLALPTTESANVKINNIPGSPGSRAASSCKQCFWRCPGRNKPSFRYKTLRGLFDTPPELWQHLSP
jgi:hypothetical protein